MSENKFRGSFATRVDDKGRLKMPADFKRELEEEQEFYITSQDGKRAQLYPMAEWKKKEEILAKIPSTKPAKIRFLAVTSKFGAQTTMDSQGRLLLPVRLRESAKVTGDVVVVGTQEYLEVVDSVLFEQETMPLTAEELNVLSEFGL